MARGKTPTGDDKFNLRVVQNGVSIKTHYFQEWKKDAEGKNIVLHHNGCPAPKEKRGGKWDFDDQNDFLCQYLEDYLGDYDAPTAPCPVADDPTPPELPPAPPEVNLDDVDDEDVPF